NRDREHADPDLASHTHAANETGERRRHAAERERSRQVVRRRRPPTAPRGLHVSPSAEQSNDRSHEGRPAPRPCVTRQRDGGDHPAGGGASFRVSMICSGSSAVVTRGGRTRRGPAGTGSGSGSEAGLNRVSTISSPESGGSVEA